MGRAGPVAADRAPGPRRRRQGRPDPQGHHRLQPAGHARDRLRGADRRGAAPRLPVARARRDPGQGPHRCLQPVALRGRARGAGQGARARIGLAGPIRAHQRLRGAPRRQRHPDREALPAHQPRRAARAVPEAARQPGEALEVGLRRPRDAREVAGLPGRLHRCARALLDRGRAVVRHPGRPQVVPRPGRGRDPGRDARAPWTPSGRSRRRTSPGS